MRKTAGPSRLKIVGIRIWAVSILLCGVSATSLASDVPRKPKVRAITAFVKIDRLQYRGQFQQALAMLRAAQAAFEKGGYEVQTLRITTQPFPGYIQGLSKEQAVEFFKAMDALSREQSFLLNIGPATLTDQVDPSQVELLGEILSHTRINASIAVAGEDGIHWNAIRAAVQTIKYVEEHSPNGANNFDFTAAAMVQPYTPYFPASYHNGEGRQFSVGLEAGHFVADVFTSAHGNVATAKESLSRELAVHARALEAIAMQVEKDSGWTYMGLDATPAPNGDSSIGAAIENLTGGKFGSSGTMTASAIITESVRSIPVMRVGYSGLMLPPLEDPVLAQRWSEGTYNLDSLLAYSAVCGTGLDAIPLPGDVTQAQLERIIGDVASLAFKWHKPLTARLIPAPGKKVGERTDFSFGVADFPNTTIRPAP